MRKSISILFLIITTPFLSVGQNFLPLEPYEPIEFDSLVPEWYETVFDSVGIENTGDGYNLLERFPQDQHIIHDEYIYSYYSKRKNNYAHTGYIIEKRKLSTGQISWRYESNFGLNEHQEVIRLLEINNNLLKVYILQSVEKIEETNIVSSPVNMRFATKSIDIHSGELVSSYYPNLENAELDTFSFARWTSGGFSYIHRNENDQLKYVKHQKVPENFISCRTISEEDGQTLANRDSFYRDVNQYHYNVLPYKNDYVALSSTFDSTFRVKIDILDSTLEPISSFYTDSIGDFYSIELLGVENDKILTRAWVETFGINIEIYKLIIFNMDGSIHRIARLDKFGIYNSTFHVFEWSEDDVYVFLSGRDYFDEHCEFSFNDIISIDENNEVQLIKRIKPQNCFRDIFLLDAIKVDDYYHFSMFEGNHYSTNPNTGNTKRDHFAKAYSQMLIHQSELGIGPPVSTHDEIAIQSVKLAPNPVDNILSITSEKTINEILIFNSNGMLLLQKDIYSKSASLDISAYPAGIYFVRCRMGNGDMVTKKMVKVDM